MIVTINDIPVYNAVLGEGDRMLRISLVDDPAVQSNFQHFDASKKPMLYAVEDEEKRLVLGVVMRADFPIYRRDDQLGEYYIVYKADTIAEMAEKYLLENRQNMVNLMHEEGSDVTGVDMVQYFLKDTAKGMAPAGFEEIADGSLFAEFHVTNDEVWDAIKDGTYKGFSLEGFFSLEPETNEGAVQDMVDGLAGKFKKLFSKTTTMSKVKKFFKALQEAFVSMQFGSVSTDKGILNWDTDEDLKAGDAVYIVDEEGNRTDAETGDYTTEDGKVIKVEDGKVTEITDKAAEVADEFSKVSTDKGDLEWDGSEDLKAGDAVYVTDADGNRVAADDGDYVTEDGKTIKVVDGKVSEIVDPAAEVAAKRSPRKSFGKVTKELFQRIAQKMSESYEEKERKLIAALCNAKGICAWLMEAGDDFITIELWNDAVADYKMYRYPYVDNGDGTYTFGDPVEVEWRIVPVDTPEKVEETAQFKAVSEELARVKADFEALKKKPAAQPAHETFTSMSAGGKTGNKGLDTLTRIMEA